VKFHLLGRRGGRGGLGNATGHSGSEVGKELKDDLNHVSNKRSKSSEKKGRQGEPRENVVGPRGRRSNTKKIHLEKRNSKWENHGCNLDI